ncbi:NUDIX hydrolase [Paenibacillus sabinae]|uniref:MutT/nudix family protein n=1 Tax=Paenibacillus sabinae T27 TaxID=1268072 RepID=X4ZJU9_9BACL|nr:NUDIX domain-containing protein [Paenibacillus sabinae]AHV96970.1 mutT/nudix family protein [Paenibacillus sabinae T27]
MGYVEDLRTLVGNQPFLLVRPSVAILNEKGQILLVKYQDQTWGIPGGLMELGETVEECIRREVKEEINIEIGSVQLFGVYSGEKLYTKLKNGHEYYNIIIGYLCTEYNGQLKPDGNEVIEAEFFDLNKIPEKTDPYIKQKLEQLGPKLQFILRASQ